MYPCRVALTRWRLVCCLLQGNLAFAIIVPALAVLAITIVLGLAFNNLPAARSYPSYW